MILGTFEAIESCNFVKVKAIFYNIIFLVLMISSFKTSAQLCNAGGNVVIFSNYDGSRETAAGRLNIVIDANIPNIKIGICSYERITVNISGPFVGNVTAVRYAGYNAIGNCNCYWPSTPPGCAVTSTITGVGAGLISYFVYPPAPFNDPNGNNNIDCAYQCVGGNQGGCNTPQQVVAYFMNAFGGTFRSHTIQYNCWAGASYSISNAGNCCLQVLPIELSYFKAELNANKVNLYWTTLSETNNKNFEVERSSDGINFEKIASIQGKGTTHQKNNYLMEDSSPTDGIIYYRLKQNDYDGGYEYSEISSVNFNMKELLFYPNPANEFINLKGLEPESIIIIKNVLGEIVLSVVNSDKSQISISQLPTGTYFVESNNFFQKLIIAR